MIFLYIRVNINNIFDLLKLKQSANSVFIKLLLAYYNIFFVLLGKNIINITNIHH
ncbi:hypothetical protein MCHI_001782 [Candidatus Magnetoovum chiemensis]|nr:hypothetical protein MCHI_001782 [Candidatus Magnetoovum chiemensis]